MTTNNNEIKILGKYALNEVYVKSRCISEMMVISCSAGQTAKDMKQANYSITTARRNSLPISAS